MDVIWENPPDAAVADRRVKYQEWADALRNEQGRWAVLPFTGKDPTGTAQAIRKGRLLAFKELGSWEALARGGKIYVRYVGE